jgi:predicted DNA-binding protein
MNKIYKDLKTTSINITEEEYILLSKKMKETGISMSSLIRKAIDKYLKEDTEI